MNGAVIPVDSDPLAPNSDDDLLDDGEEFLAGTSPRQGDTDEDGMYDHAEGALGRDPTITDKRIYVEATSAIVIDPDEPSGDAEPRIDVLVKLDDGEWVKKADLNGDDIDEDEAFGGTPIELYEGVFVSDTRLEVKFEGYEYDSVGSNDAMQDVVETVWINTPPPSGEEQITLDMYEVDGDTHFRFVLTVREVTTP